MNSKIMKLTKNKRMKGIISLLLFSLIATSHSSAQLDRTNSGKDFYIAFGKNNQIVNIVATTNPVGFNVELILRITAFEDTQVALSFTENDALNDTFSVPAGTIYDYVLSMDQAKAAYSGSQTSTATKKKSIRVTTTKPVTLIAVNSAKNSIEATLVNPVESWGTEYYIINLPVYSTDIHCDGYLVIAKEKNTQVTTTQRYGVKTDILLNEGEMYHYYNTSSWNQNGTHIESDKPVAVFSTNTLGKITTSDIDAYNYNFEQLAPVNQWGKKFILPTNELKAGLFKIYPKEFPTAITVTYSDGTQKTDTIKNLPPNYGIYNIIMDGTNNVNATACYVTTNKPVGICAFQKVRNNGSWQNFQPSVAWLPPVEQMTRNVFVSPLALNGQHVYSEIDHYLTFIVPTASKKSTTVSINGAAPQPVDNLPNTTFSWKANNIGDSGYSFGQYYIGKSYIPGNIYLNTTVLVDNPDGIIVMAHSGGGYATYYYTAGSSFRDLLAGFTVNDVNYIDMDWKGICNTSNFTFKSNPDTLTNVVWKINGALTGSGNKITVNDLPDGFCVAEMVANGKTYTTHFFVGGLPVVWTPYTTTGDERYNWNNRANWNPAVVPNACNNVFIPGNLDYYPNLTSNAACNSIYFIQGAELGRPDLLTYEKAYIQYNFGLMQTKQTTDKNDMNLVLNSTSTIDRMKYSAAVSAASLKRERWYMLSSPLKDVVTGDLSFGGFPLTFLKKFGPVNKDNQNYPVGNWTTSYNSMNEGIAKNSTDGFAFFMYGYGMTRDNTGCEESGNFGRLNDLDYLPDARGEESYGIEKTNGILELPFFADSTNLYAHRTQVYDANLNESTFYYIDDDQSQINALTGQKETVQRKSDNGNYRFAPEYYDSNSGNWIFETRIKHPVKDLISGEDFLTGNPYMSSIDMVEFCKDNAASIESEYKIWNGEDFNSFSIDVNGGGIASHPANNSLHVSPMQGFFLTYKGGDVVFNVKNISMVRPAKASFNLRSDRKTVEENILRIKAENKKASSHAVVGYRDGADNGFVRGEDVRKLFTPFTHVPAIYSLAGDIPVDINFVNNNGEVIVPLGIKTGQTGEITLTFTGMDNYFKASKIELIDAKENRIIDLTGKASYSYSFNHTETGIQNGRFSLSLSNYSMTSLSNVNSSDDIKIYGDSKGIYVLSPPSDPVQQVTVYDIQGRKLNESVSGAKYYPLQDNCGNSPLIVKVTTKNSVKTTKINP